MAQPANDSRISGGLGESGTLLRSSLLQATNHADQRNKAAQSRDRRKSSMGIVPVIAEEKKDLESDMESA